MDQAPAKKRCLNYDKCSFCREAKKRCEPVHRTWPQKCNRCIEYNLKCSQNMRTGGSPRVHLQKIHDLSLRVSWLRRLKLYEKSARIIINGNHDEPQPVQKIFLHIEKEKSDIYKDVKVALAEFQSDYSFMMLWAMTVLLNAEATYSVSGHGPVGVVNADTVNRARDNGDSGGALMCQEIRVINMLQSDTSDTRLRAEIRQYCEIYHEAKRRLEHIRGTKMMSMPPLHTLLLLTNGNELLGKRLVQLASTYTGLAEEDILSRSLLHLALDLGMQGELDPFIFHKSVNSSDIFNRSPIQVASAAGNFKATVQLLQQGCDADFKDLWGRTALSRAAQNGHDAVVKRLLAPELLATSKVELDSEDEYGRTPLSWAAANGHGAVVQLFLALELLATSKIKPDSKDKYGRTPLSWAAANGHSEVVQLLLAPKSLSTSIEKLDLVVADNDGWIPLNLASTNGHVEVVRLLLEKGADLMIANNSGWTPLNSASSNGHFEVVRLLLDKGADPTLANADGWTPLNSASSNGHFEVVRLLLENGADQTIANNDGCTPLNSASSNGYIEVVKLLLDKGADMMVANTTGWTPLNSAADSGCIQVVKLLLENGADLTVANNDGWTPLNSASDSGHVDVVELLLEKGADMTIPNNNGWTPLNSASSNGHTEVVKLLLKKGADPTVANNNGWVPLNSALNNGHAEVVSLLLEGADPTITDNG